MRRFALVALVGLTLACGKKEGEETAPPTSGDVPPEATRKPTAAGLAGCEAMDIGPFQEAFIRRYTCGEQIASAMIGPGPQSHEGHMQMLVDQASKHGYETQAESGEGIVGDERLPLGFIFHKRPGEEGLVFTMLVVTVELGDDAFLAECTVKYSEDEAETSRGVDLCTGVTHELLQMARDGTFREI